MWAISVKPSNQTLSVTGKGNSLSEALNELKEKAQVREEAARKANGEWEDVLDEIFERLGK